MTRSLQKLFLIMAPVLVMWGCSSGTNPDAPIPHPSNEQWVSQHGDRFIETGGNQCRACHGDELTGGSAIGCGITAYRLPNGNVVLCHGGVDAGGSEAGPFGHHVEGFIEPTNPLAFHGNFAKGVPKMDPAAPFGFEECTDCHGREFSGKTIPGPSQGDTITTADCRSCHVGFFGVSAPHTPSEEWTANHQMTDPDNGEACAVCHYQGENFPPADPLNPTIVPESSIVETPSCFNAFLCHGQKPATHPTDAPEVGWDGHGAAAMNAPAPGEPPAGFLTCNACHGSFFSGDAGNSAPACQSCHGINAPHPEEEEWIPAHIGTDPLNASVCAWCHRKSDATPGCFNNSMCH